MKKELNITKILCIIYCFLLLWIILFKTSFTLEEIKYLVGNRSVNLIPFYYENEVVSFHAKEVLWNAIIFIPFGIYLRMLGTSAKKVVLYGFLFSVLMETCQFLFAIGASDITDILTNTFGTIVGVVFYTLLERGFRNKIKINKILNSLASIATICVILLAVVLFVAN